MAADPQILKIITFTLDGTDFSEDVLDVEVVPTPGDVQTIRTLDGVTHQDASSESWGLRIRAVVDWDTTRPGLASYLFDNKGTSVAFAFRDTTGAISTTKPAITGNVTLVPLSYGGTGNAFAESEVVLPIDGDPVVDTTP